MDAILAIADLARRTGYEVEITADPWPHGAAHIQWTVAAFQAATPCRGSSTRLDDAVAQCSAAVDRALGATEYPQSKEG